MYVTEGVASSESLATFDVFVLDAGDTLYVWGGEQCSQLEVKLATFFAEHSKSMRNSDVEVSRTTSLKFWMFLGAEEREFDLVRCVSIVQLPRSSGATHSWIPYRSRTWFGAHRPKYEVAEFLPRRGDLSLCGVGWALKSQLCLSPRCEEVPCSKE